MRDDRFQLKIHLETREVPVYELTVAKGGPKLGQAEVGNCTRRNPSDPGQPLKPGQAPYCTMVLKNGSMAELSQALRTAVDRPIIDKTGITGNFDLGLEFARDQAAVSPQDPDA